MDSMQRSLELGEEGGFEFAGIASRVELARIHARAGDADRALQLAEQALELARERLPVAVPFVQPALAESRLAAGDVGGARAALDAGPLLGPEPGRTFALIAIELARSRVALADGDAAAAAAHAAGVIEDLRSRGIRVMVAEARVLLARALMLQGRLEEAERELAEAAEEAERLHERPVLAEARALRAELRARERAPGGDAGS
jgi:tetratricopeptide (TPR) repeat protein